MQVTGGQPCASWQGLIRDGIEHCLRTKLLSNDQGQSLLANLATEDVSKLLEIAQAISSALGAPEGGEFRRWLQHSVGALEIRDRNLLDAIHGLGVPIATTNYDDLLTRGRGLAAVPWTNGPAALEVIRGDRQGVMHLHGYYEDPGSVVLGVNSYQELLSAKGAQALQQTIVLSKTLIFIGCGGGLIDPNFSALLEWSTDLFGDTIYRHYYLCIESEAVAMRIRYPAYKRLFPVVFGKDFSALPGFLHGPMGSTLKSRRPQAPATLPALGYCVGREGKVAEVVTALLGEHPGAVPVIGGPGMGKSTIALSALHDRSIAVRFGERRWFVRCDAASSRTELIAAIASALGLPITPTVEDDVFASLSTGPGVLLLDNAETPLEADTAAVEALLAKLSAIDSLALLVTIRRHKRPRGVPWRASIEATRFDDLAAKNLFLAVCGKPQVGNDPVFPRLLAVLDGVPLAISLMARYAELFDSLEPVWEKWDRERTAMLEDGSSPDRSTSIAISYELSIGALPASARRLLSALASLPSGIALQDLPKVFPESESPSLVLRAWALVFDDGLRLRMLAPLREHVTLAHNPHPEDLQALEDYYIGLANSEGNQIGRAGGAHSVARLSPEVANIETMLLRCSASRLLGVDDAAVAWSRFIRASGLGSVTLLEQHAERLLAAQEFRGAGRCLVTLGDIDLVRPNPQSAWSRYERALPLLQRTHDLEGEAICVQRFGDVLFIRLNYAAAQAKYEEALILFERVQSQRGQGDCIKSLGEIALVRSNHETARQLFERALPLHEQAGWQQGKANCFSSLGDISLSASDYETALRWYLAALSIYRTVGDTIGEANCIKRLGDLALKQSDYRTARIKYDDALLLYQRVGDQQREADCISGLGDVAEHTGCRDEAVERYSAALVSYQGLGEPFSIGSASRSLARLAPDELTRLAHVTTARAAWHSVRLDNRVAELDAEFGTTER